MKVASFSAAGSSALGAALLTFSAIGAQAQTGAERATAAIEEIVVTSRRMEESIQDIPVSVTAFTQEDVEQIAPRTLRDFDGLAPNLRIGMNTAGPSAGAIYIRGIGYAGIEKTSTPAVGVVIDGVYQGSNTGQLIDTFDVRQMEINRGPQGVLQGKNTTGGSIVVTRFQPEFNEFGFFASGQYGDYDKQQFKGRVNIPLIEDQLALKIAGITKERDGYYDNVTEGCDECAGDIDYDAATVALRWAPIEAFEATFTYDYIKDRGDIPPQDPTWDGDDPYENAANYDEFQKYDVDGYALNMSYDFDFGTLTSVSSYTDSKDDVGQDFDGGSRTSGASPLGTLHTLREQEFEVWTQELKLNGDMPWLADNLQYTVGGYYYKSKLDFAQGTNLIVQIPNPAPGVSCGLVVPGWEDNPGAIGNALCQLPNSYANQEMSERVKSYAGFGALTWNVTDTIELHAGLRYINEKKEFRQKWGERGAPTTGPVDQFYGDPINPPNLPGIVTFPPFPVDDDNRWDKVVGEASVTWQYTDSNMVYLSYSEGFRSGGFSARGTDPNRLTFGPETIDAWELGSKNDFWDNRLRVNAVAFHMKLDDAQITSILNQPEPPGTNTLILNSAGTKTYGVELEVTASVTDNITLMFVGGYNDVESDDSSFSCTELPNPPLGFACNPVLNPDLFVGGEPVNLPLEGGDTLFTPEWNTAVTALYDRQIGPGHLFASVSAVTTDDVAIAIDQNQELFYVDGYTLFNARLAYEWDLPNDDLLTIEAAGKNLGDKTYQEQRLFLGNGLFQGWAPPRTWTLSLSYTH